MRSNTLLCHRQDRFRHPPPLFYCPQQTAESVLVQSLPEPKVPNHVQEELLQENLKIPELLLVKKKAWLHLQEVWSVLLPVLPGTEVCGPIEDWAAQLHPFQHWGQYELVEIQEHHNPAFHRPEDPCPNRMSENDLDHVEPE